MAIATTIFFMLLLRPEKYSMDPSCRLNACVKSSGMTSASTSSNKFQLPFCWAISTLLNPAGAIFPAAISLVTFSLLIFDQVLCWLGSYT